jgi:hypothetical protein
MSFCRGRYGIKYLHSTYNLRRDGIPEDRYQADPFPESPDEITQDRTCRISRIEDKRNSNN